MAKTTANKNKASWDAPENEAQNNFVTWGEPGDYILGTLVGRKQVESTLPDRAGELQWVYETKIRDCSYHLVDDKKRVIEEPVTPDPGELISVGGRAMIDSRMARVKLGQVFGLKFTEELPAKTKGFNPTKVIKVYTPRDTDGEFEMDAEWLDEHKDELEAEEEWKKS